MPRKLPSICTRVIAAVPIAGGIGLTKIAPAPLSRIDVVADARDPCPGRLGVHDGSGNQQRRESEPFPCANYRCPQGISLVVVLSCDQAVTAACGCFDTRSRSTKGRIPPCR